MCRLRPRQERIQGKDVIGDGIDAVSVERTGRLAVKEGDKGPVAVAVVESRVLDDRRLVDVVDGGAFAGEGVRTPQISGR